MKDIIYVNQTKLERAKDIVALVTGVRVIKDMDDKDMREKFSHMLTTEKIDPKGEEAVEFVYTKLGGLVRTKKEQAAADERKKEMIAKGKKRMIQ